MRPRKLHRAVTARRAVRRAAARADRGFGRGIPDEDNNIFDMFYNGSTGKPGGKSGDFKRGMGLGLSLCRSIVEVHGGTLQVRNRKPCGSEFWFTLPAVDAEDVVARSVEAVRG